MFLRAGKTKGEASGRVCVPENKSLTYPDLPDLPGGPCRRGGQNSGLNVPVIRICPWMRGRDPFHGSPLFDFRIFRKLSGSHGSPGITEQPKKTKHSGQNLPGMPDKHHKSKADGFKCETFFQIFKIVEFAIGHNRYLNTAVTNIAVAYIYFPFSFIVCNVSLFNVDAVSPVCFRYDIRYLL